MGYKYYSLKCKICDRDFKNNQGLIKHVYKAHNLTSKEHYDKFYKKDTDGYCVICKNSTPWSPRYGIYLSYCCKKCQIKGIEKKYNTTNITHISPEKRKQTCLKKYGSEYIGNSDYQRNNMKKYWASLNEKEKQQITKKAKQTCLKKYGVDNYTKTAEFREKFTKTMLTKYGVEHALQYQPFFNKVKDSDMAIKKPYILPSKKIIYVQGYENKFLDYIFNKNILTENEIIHEPFSIEYELLDKTKRYYYPDFYIPRLNLIIEIKSTYTEKIDKFIELKKQACLQKGYQYCRIINNDFISFEKNLGL